MSNIKTAHQKEHYEAIGELLMAAHPLEKMRGGRQAIQKIVGASMFKIVGKRAFWYTYKFHELTIEEMKKLTARINKVVERRTKRN